MKKLFLCCFSYLVVLSAAAQQKRAGDILIQISPEYTVREVLESVGKSVAFKMESAQPIAPRWRIHLLHFATPENESAETLLDQVNRIPGVAVAQWNYEAQDRNVTPNDTEWLEQRDMGLINVAKAWENTTGGLTPAGDTIVVAVLEKGIQKENPDLFPNIWRNWKEIPDNNIDDDNNGYVDDFMGWDARFGGDGNGNGSSHGTSVSGIVGARGNDEFGVTGVSWNVKMLTVVNVALDAEIIAAYYYAGEMRRRYNESQGKEGAFVVATNASFGFDFDFPEDHPLWCPVFDSLGLLGVLGVGATVNSDANVESVGDMPTLCGSEFLITVTNVDANTGKKVTGAGYGAVSIDMGAPGQGTFTTTNRVIAQGDTLWHASFGGTSAACPHVSGSVGLLYSVTCNGFVADAISHPAACARRVRDAILRNVTPEPTLDGKTTTGGRLDVNAVVEDVMELCAGTSGDLAVSDIRPNPVRTELEIRYQTPDYARYTMQAYNMLGQKIYDETFEPPAFEPKIIYLNVANWMPGTYILTFGQGNSVITKKFVKI